MKKYKIGIPIMVLLISLAGLSFFIYTNHSQANTSVSSDACAITESSSLSDIPQIETITSNDTTESGKEYAVVELTG